MENTTIVTCTNCRMIFDNEQRKPKLLTCCRLHTLCLKCLREVRTVSSFHSTTNKSNTICLQMFNEQFLQITRMLENTSLVLPVVAKRTVVRISPPTLITLMSHTYCEVEGGFRCCKKGEAKVSFLSLKKVKFYNVPNARITNF